MSMVAALRMGPSRGLVILMMILILVILMVLRLDQQLHNYCSAWSSQTSWSMMVMLLAQAQMPLVSTHHCVHSSIQQHAASRHCDNTVSQLG